MLLPGVGRGVLHDGDGGVRPRRAVPDAGVRDDATSTSGMNNWMSDAVHVSRASRSIAARCSTPETLKRARRVGPLQGRGRRRHPVPHDPRRPACRPYFTRGSGHNEQGQYSERPDDYVENMDRLARKFETARQLRAEAGGRATSAGARDRHHRLRHRATGRSTRAATSCARRRGVETVVPPAARVSVHRRADGVHRRARARLRRRAEPRRADAAADAARAARRSRSTKLRSVLHYNGLPIDARSITDDVLAQEGFEVREQDRPARVERGHGRWTNDHDGDADRK